MYHNKDVLWKGLLEWVFDDLLRKRKAFVRLWRWVMAVGCVQICALYLDRVTKVQ